jgi:hypothetical protein
VRQRIRAPVYFCFLLTSEASVWPPLPLWERVGERGSWHDRETRNEPRPVPKSGPGSRPRRCPLSPTLSHKGRGGQRMPESVGAPRSLLKINFPWMPCFGDLVYYGFSRLTVRGLAAIVRWIVCGREGITDQDQEPSALFPCCPQSPSARHFFSRPDWSEYLRRSIDRCHREPAAVKGGTTRANSRPRAARSTTFC